MICDQLDPGMKCMLDLMEVELNGKPMEDLIPTLSLL